MNEYDLSDAVTGTVAGALYIIYVVKKQFLLVKGPPLT